MNREFTNSDVRFFEEHDAKLYSRLKTLPIAIVGLDVEGVIALSWRDGVLNLDLDRELRHLMDSAVVSTQAAAVWGDDLNPYVTDVAPLTDAAGAVINGSGVAVAVVDSGIDGTHPDLVNRVIGNFKHICSTPGLGHTGYDRCYGNSMLHMEALTPAGLGDAWVEPWIETTYSDTASGHGTHVAGIVAGDGTMSDGRVRGAAPGADLVGFGAGEVILVGGALESWDKLYQEMSNGNFTHVKVVTNSFGDCPATPWGGNMNEPAPRLIKKFVDDFGVVFTFAAGNVDSTCDYPTDGSVDTTSSYCDMANVIDGVICVANGVDQNSGLRDKMTVADGSSRGLASNPDTWPEVTAPGSDIEAAWAAGGVVAAPGTNLYYTSLTGTSMATPHVAGIVALMFQANPALTPAEVESILTDTAIKFEHGEAYDANGRSFDKGAGLVNALAAVNTAKNATGAGSDAYGMGGRILIWQPGGVNPFGVTADQVTIVNGTNVTMNLVGADVASYTPPGTLNESTPREFRIVNADGVTVASVTENIAVENDATFGGKRVLTDWVVDAPLGEHTLQVWLHGLLAKASPLRVINAPSSTDDVPTPDVAPAPACVEDAPALAFTASGVRLTGRITSAPAPVDKIRVMSVLGNDVLGAVVTARESDAGLVEWSVPLTQAMVTPGAELGIYYFASTIPCFANVHVPDVTPENLASTQPAGVFQIGNPWMNPGFEFASPIEWDSALSPDWRAQARSVAPPTYLRAYDGERGTPHSTHEVTYGNGTSGNALVLHYNASDDSRNLILGQFFGPPEAGPWVWLGADTIEFEYRTTAALDDLAATVHFIPVNGNQTGIGGSVTLQNDGEWHRAVIDVSAIPDNATLTGAVIHISGDEHGDIAFDNVRVTGSTFSVVDLHSDVTDGYAMIVHPETADETVNAVDALKIAPLITGKGEAFVAQTKLRDFTGITPEWVDARDARYFIFGIAGTSYVENGWSTNGLERDIEGAVKVDGSAVAFAVDKEATLAQTDNGLGVAYAYWNISKVSEANDRLVYSGEGYYSAFKNAVQDYSLADQLDAAVTPVHLLDEAAAIEVEGLNASSIHLADANTSDGKFEVMLEVPATGWMEKATVSVTGHPDRVVQLDGETTHYTLVYSGSTEGKIASFSGSIFTYPSTFNPLAPVADIAACVDAFTCNESVTEVLSLTEVKFNASASTDPQGTGLTYQWNFADGTGAEGAEVTHVFTSPGTYTVSVNVTDGQGNSDIGLHAITVLNRAPNVTAIVPEQVTRTLNLTVPVSGTDLDGSVDALVVKFDGDTLTTANAGTALVTIPKAELTLGPHELTVTALDNDGAEATETIPFEVVNLAPVVDLQADETLVGKGGNVTFTAFGSDADSPSLTLKLAFGDGSEQDVVDGENVTHAFATAGEYLVTLTANDTEGGVTNATMTIVVDGTAPVTTASVEDDAWHTGNVSVELTAVDNHSEATTFFKVDDGNLSEYEGAFEVGGDGTHTVTFYSVDAFGNAEDAQSVTVKIDSGLPTINMTEMPGDFEVVTGNETLFASAEDDGSGVASVRILIDGEECGAGETEAECAWDTSGTTIGFFELTVEATDVAGNVATQTVMVFVMNGLVLPLGASLPVIL